MNTIKALCVLGLLTIGGAAHSQTFWQQRDHAPSARIEMALPIFPSESWMEAHDGMRLQIGARVPVSTRTLLAFEFPMASSSEPVGFMESTTDWEIGCPYLGVEIAGVGHRRMSLEFGLRLPLGRVQNAYCYAVGNAADPERLGAFSLLSDQTWTLSTALNYDSRSARNVLVGGRVGLATMLPSDTRLSIWGGNWPETAVQYGYRMGFAAGKTTLLAGLSGFVMIGEYDSNAQSRWHNFFRVSTAFDLGRVAPELFVSKQLGKRQRYYEPGADYTVGLGFTMR